VPATAWLEYQSLGVIRVEVLRRYSNNYSAAQRVVRLTRHLQRQGKDRAPQAPLPRTNHQPHKLSQRLSDETVIAILAAYQDGATTREVGERFGLAHSSVNKLLKQQGVIARRRSPTPEEVQRAVQLYEARYGTQAIAEQLGFGTSTIRRALVNAGIRLRPRFHG
jgi:hypothetical protein